MNHIFYKGVYVSYLKFLQNSYTREHYRKSYFFSVAIFFIFLNMSYGILLKNSSQNDFNCKSDIPPDKKYVENWFRIYGLISLKLCVIKNTKH